MPSILKNTYNSRFISLNDCESFLIRSDKIDNCSQEDINYLVNHGIESVIDFRNLENKTINVYLKDFNINFINYPITTKIDKDNFINKYGTNGHCFEYYVFLIQLYDKMGDIFRIINNTQGGLLINCSAGRDRTGIVSFLIELLGEFAVDTIAYDMAITELNLISRPKPSNLVLQSALDYEKALKRGYKLFDYFFTEYKSVPNYFEKCGIKDEEFISLKKRIKELINH